MAPNESEEAENQTIPWGALWRHLASQQAGVSGHGPSLRPQLGPSCLSPSMRHPLPTFPCPGPSGEPHTYSLSLCVHRRRGAAALLQLTGPRPAIQGQRMVGRLLAIVCPGPHIGRAGPRDLGSNKRPNHGLLKFHVLTVHCHHSVRRGGRRETKLGGAEGGEGERMAQPAPERGNVCGGNVTEPFFLHEIGYAN